ncbi:SCAN domain protein [Anaplasma phagocytophilum]|uniref:SCAN domain protein n=1 Tax=Anaplasma phagocytophilum TaxID=948 RepID=A0AA45UUV6_ANAPH|nr:SCAN domain protein [Anaplasma phagocytophilum]
MDLMRLLRTDLFCLCEELGVEVEQKMKKSEISKAISESAEVEEIKIAWELLLNAKSEAAAREEREREQAAAREEQEQAAAREEREREEAAARREREQAAAREERAQAATEERALKRLELEIEQQRLNSQNSRVGAPVRASETESYQMKKLMQPFKVGEDVGLFLVNFERTCEKLSFAPETWPQRLLTLLPCEAAEVVARLSAGDADDYDKVKSSLLKRYRLSAEAFRQRFRNASKKSSEGYSEFAYGLKTNLIEWLKSEEVYESRDKVVECVCLEQFFRSIPQSVKLWVQDRVGVDTVERAAELAEEYATRRKLSGEESEPGRSDQRKTFRQGNGSRENGPEKPEAGQKVPEKSAEHSNGDEARKSQTGQFEARKPFLCYNCQEPGHTAARCKKPRVVFSTVTGSDEDLELLRPYLHELQVNGKPCRVLRDSAATMDVVHPSFVTTSDFTGKVVWIKQLLEKHSVCLPMATVRITGPFGELVTEAAVSQTVPLEYPYLFSNRSEFLLRERGQQLGEGLVQSGTRSKSRQLAPLLTSDPEPEAAVGEQALPQFEAEKRDERDQVVEQPDLVALESVRRPNEPAKKAEEDGISERSLVAPASRNFGPLLRADGVSLTVEQKSDPSVSGFRGTAQEIARTNVTGHEKGRLFYRR